MTDNTLNDIREKTEENEMQTYLKPNLGGYTKQSVLDYLAYLKKSQQDQKDAFLQQIQHLQKEKEALQKKNAELEADMDEALDRIRMDEEELTRLKECSGDLPAAEEVISEEGFGLTRTRMEEMLQYAETFMEQIRSGADTLKDHIEKTKTCADEHLFCSNTQMTDLQGQLQTALERYEVLECEKESLAASVREYMDRNVSLERENSRIKAEFAILRRHQNG